MEAVSTRGLSMVRGEALVCALLAAVAATTVAVLAPPGGDTAAHLYRVELLRDGVLLWDERWFGGHYPLAAYSLLYYLPAALVGNAIVVVAATIVSARLFASLALEEWGDAARWPARVFAVLAAGPLFTGTYSYAAGLAAALGVLRLLQVGRPRLAVVAALVCVALSPLAFAFLCVAVGAVGLARGRLDRLAVGVGGGLAGVATAQLAVLAVFPSDGRYPFSRLSLAAALVVCGLGAALAFRGGRAPVLGWLFALWGAACLVGFAVPSPLGDNLTRLRAIVFALVLLAAVTARFRPRLLALTALAFGLGYNLLPDLSAAPKRIEDARTAEAAFWAPALDWVAERARPGERVEVVPTFGHWEAYWVPRAGLPLARGWYRQIDMAENPELYADPLEPAAYRAWLDRNAVRFVLLPDARLGPMGADREAALLRSGRAGLRVVSRSASWTIYEVRSPAPLATGPGRATVLALQADVVALDVAAPGEYRLSLRWTPHRRVAAGDACLARAEDGSTLLRVLRAGRIELRPSLRPGSPGCV